MADYTDPTDSPQQDPKPQTETFEQKRQRYAKKHGIPDEISAALVNQESGGRPHATSYKGAMGVMQIMPDTFDGIQRELGRKLDPYNEDDNMEAGHYYLSKILKGTGGQMARALMQYHGGPAGDRKLNSDDGYITNAAYASDIIDRARSLRSRRTPSPTQSGQPAPKSSDALSAEPEVQQQGQDESETNRVLTEGMRRAKNQTPTRIRVRDGETVDSIAKRYGTTADDLRRFNQAQPNFEVQDGDQISVPNPNSRRLVAPVTGAGKHLPYQSTPQTRADIQRTDVDNQRAEAELAASNGQTETPTQPETQDPPIRTLANGQRVHVMPVSTNNGQTDSVDNTPQPAAPTAQTPTLSSPAQTELQRKHRVAQVQLRQAVQRRRAIAEQVRAAQSQVDPQTQAISQFTGIGTDTLTTMQKALAAQNAQVETARQNLQGISRMLGLSPTTLAQTSLAQDARKRIGISDVRQMDEANVNAAQPSLADIRHADDIEQTRKEQIRNELRGPLGINPDIDIDEETEKRWQAEKASSSENEKLLRSLTPDDWKRVKGDLDEYHNQGWSRPAFEGMQGSFANTETQLANALHLVTLGYVGDGIKRDAAIRELATQMSRQENDDPHASIWSQLRDSVLRGAGSATLEVPKMIFTGKALGAFSEGAEAYTLPTLGALSELDKGVIPAARGALEGAAMHKGFEYIAPLGRLRAGVAGILAPTAYDVAVKGANPVDALGSNVSFGILGGLGPERMNVVDPQSLDLRPATASDLSAIRRQELIAVPKDIPSEQLGQLRSYLRLEREKVEGTPDRYVPDSIKPQPKPAPKERVGDYERFNVLPIEDGKFAVTDNDTGKTYAPFASEVAAQRAKENIAPKTRVDVRPTADAQAPAESAVHPLVSIEKDGYYVSGQRFKSITDANEFAKNVAPNLKPEVSEKLPTISDNTPANEPAKNETSPTPAENPPATQEAASETPAETPEPKQKRAKPLVNHQTTPVHEGDRVQFKAKMVLGGAKPKVVETGRDKQTGIVVETYKNGKAKAVISEDGSEWMMYDGKPIVPEKPKTPALDVKLAPPAKSVVPKVSENGKTSQKSNTAQGEPSESAGKGTVKRVMSAEGDEIPIGKRFFLPNPVEERKGMFGRKRETTNFDVQPVTSLKDGLVGLADGSFHSDESGKFVSDTEGVRATGAHHPLEKETTGQRTRYEQETFKNPQFDSEVPTTRASTSDDTVYANPAAMKVAREVLGRSEDDQAMPLMGGQVRKLIDGLQARASKVAEPEHESLQNFIRHLETANKLGGSSKEGLALMEIAPELRHDEYRATKMEEHDHLARLRLAGPTISNLTHPEDYNRIVNHPVFRRWYDRVSSKDSMYRGVNEPHAMMEAAASAMFKNGKGMIRNPSEQDIKDTMDVAQMFVTAMDKKHSGKSVEDTVNLVEKELRNYTKAVNALKDRQPADAEAGKFITETRKGVGRVQEESRASANGSQNGRPAGSPQGVGNTVESARSLEKEPQVVAPSEGAKQPEPVSPSQVESKTAIPEDTHQDIERFQAGDLYRSLNESGYDVRVDVKNNLTINGKPVQSKGQENQADLAIAKKRERSPSELDFEREAKEQTTELAKRQSGFQKAISKDPYDPTAWRKKLIEANDKKPLSATQSARLNVLLAQGRAAKTTKESIKATRDLVEFMTYLKPTRAAEVIAAWYRAGMLSAGSVTAKNMTANALHQALMETERIPAGFLDWAASAGMFGKSLKGTPRQVQGLSAGAFWHSYVKGQGSALKAFGEAMRYGNTDLDMQSVAQKYDQSRLLRLSEKLPKVIRVGGEFLPNTVFKFQGAQDAYFRNLAYRRALYEQAWLKQKNQGGNLWTYYHAPDAQMTENALDYSAFAVFQQDNKITEAVHRFKEKLDPISKTFLTYRMPFMKTGANVAGEIMQMTGVPQALKMTKMLTGKPFKEIWDAVPNQERRTFLLAASRGAVGMSLFTLGYILQGHHIATGISPKDDDGQKNAKQGAGLSEGSVSVLGHNLDISSLGPASAIFIAGASLRERVSGKYKNDRSIPNNILAVGMNLLEENPFMEASGKFFDKVGQEDYLGAVLDPNLSKFVPMSGALRDMARLQDPERVQRETKGDTLLETGANQLRNVLPKTPFNPNFNRESLPLRRDWRGRVISDPNPFDPLRSKTDTSADSVNSEVLSQGYRPMYPKQKKDESRADYRERRDAETGATNRMLTRAVDSPIYQSSPTKSDELKSVQSEAFRAGSDRLRPPSMARNTDVVLLRDQTLRDADPVIADYERDNKVELTDEQRKKVKRIVAASFTPSKMNQKRERSSVDRTLSGIDWHLTQNESLRKLTILDAIEKALYSNEEIPTEDDDTDNEEQ
jgi:LysM repeat protein